MKSKYACLSAALLLLGIPCRAQVPAEKLLGEYDKLVSQLKSGSLVGEPIRAGGTTIIPFASVNFGLVGGDAKIVAPGELKLDGYRLVCGQRPTVLDNNLDDYGAAYPGFLILNPRLLAKVSLPVKLWMVPTSCGELLR